MVRKPQHERVCIVVYPARAHTQRCVVGNKYRSHHVLRPNLDPRPGGWLACLLAGSKVRDANVVFCVFACDTRTCLCCLCLVETSMPCPPFENPSDYILDLIDPLFDVPELVSLVATANT